MITINVVEWVLYLVVIWLHLALANIIISLFDRYLKWRIKKEKTKKPNQITEREFKNNLNK